MNLAEYAAQDAMALADLIRRGELAPNEVTDLALSAIERLNPQLNCVVETFPDRGRDPDTRVTSSFYGVPYLGKDLPFEKGVRAEMGSELARGYISPFDTELAHRLRKAGAVNLGRTVTSEFAFAAVTENRLNGKVANPWDPARSTAGSSGGAAASVASGMVPFAQGTDAGGSIRMPSSFCGLVGLKPTRARVPLAPASLLSYGGLNNMFVLTRSVRDCAALLDAVEGPTVGASFAIPRPEMAYLAAIAAAPKPLRIAFTTKAWSGVPVDDEVQQAVWRVAKLCAELGHRVDEKAPRFDYGRFIAAQKTMLLPYVVQDIDAVARDLGRTPGPDNLQSTSWDLYRRGQSVSGTTLLDGLDVYSEISREVAIFFRDCDLLLTPTCTIVPRPLGTYDPDVAGGDTDTMFEQLAPHESFTSLFNGTGQPALSLPLEQSDGGLPIGIQLIGRFGDEATVLRLAAQLEQAKPWRDRRPRVHAANL